MKYLYFDTLAYVLYFHYMPNLYEFSFLSQIYIYIYIYIYDLESKGSSYKDLNVITLIEKQFLNLKKIFFSLFAI